MLYAPSPVASLRPSGDHLTLHTARLWPRRIARHCPVATSHSRTVPSALPEASLCPPAGGTRPGPTQSLCALSRSSTRRRPARPIAALGRTRPWPARAHPQGGPGQAVHRSLVTLEFGQFHHRFWRRRRGNRGCLQWRSRRFWRRGGSGLGRGRHLRGAAPTAKHDDQQQAEPADSLVIFHGLAPSRLPRNSRDALDEHNA